MVTDEEVLTALTLLGYKHATFNRGLLWRMEMPGIRKSVGRRRGDEQHYAYEEGSYYGVHSATQILKFLGGARVP